LFPACGQYRDRGCFFNAILERVIQLAQWPVAVLFRKGLQESPVQDARAIRGLLLVLVGKNHQNDRS